MNCIEFSDVSFKYPSEEGDFDENGKQIEPPFVFEHFTGAIPSGFTSLIGPNGSGKSTFLLLASGRLAPQTGICTLFGQDVLHLQEEQKNRLASVIYQNMEFESNEKVLVLLKYVYTHGALNGNAPSIRDCEKNLLEEVIEMFCLSSILERGLKELSKGEIQRVLIAFCLLYGSATVFMDEPMFAMERSQMEIALSYLREFSEKKGTSFFISMHELDLTRRFADKVILFYPNRDMDYGTPEEVMTDEALEKAYGVPVSMLKHREDMTRDELIQSANAILALQDAK